MAQPLWLCHRRKLLGLQGRNGLNLTTSITIMNTGFEGEEACGNGDVRRLCKQGLLKEPLHTVNILDQRSIRPESSTYASLLQECVNARALPEGMLIHAHMILTGFNSDIYLNTKLVIMYAKCGSLVDARRFFEELPARNVVAWTSMIAAYAKQGLDEDALTLFYQMQRAGIQPNEFTIASVLPACAKLVALDHGRNIHERVINLGFQDDLVVRNALVDMYWKCGRIEDSRQVFDRMSERNVVSWNAMLAGYAQNGHVDEVLKLFQKMPVKDEISWNAMIAGYARNGRVEEALRLFQRMPERNVISWNAMIAGCAQRGHVDEALKLFQAMPERNVVSWNTVIAGFAQNGCCEEALNLFGVMQLRGVKRDSVTFISVLSACAYLAALTNGRKVHEDIISSGFQSEVFVESALVDMYAKCGSIEDACQVFDKMRDRDVVSWTAMIVGYAMHGCGNEALKLFEQMRCSGTEPNCITFMGVLSACCHAGLVDDGWQCFDIMSRDYHITPTVEHYCCMVDLLGRAGHLDEARDFINRMPIKPNAASWGSLLAACRVHTNIELGEHVAECLFKLEPKNAARYVLLSNIYAAAGRWDGVERVRKMMKDHKVKKDPGCSWTEINGKVYSFLTGDRSHPQMHEIYAELERLFGQMKEAGYVPDMSLVLHDVEVEQKEHILHHHSEKLAIVFALINTSPTATIRVVKNLRVCADCHSVAKFISKIVVREIVVRDTHRFHHFKDGQCSCGEYW